MNFESQGVGVSPVCVRFREEQLKPTFKNKRSWLLGTAALALAVSSPAYAQDAAAEEDETATLDVVKERYASNLCMIRSHMLKF